MALKEQLWTKKEESLLKKLYPTNIALEDLLKKFPGRSASSLAHKASKLKIKKGKYIPKTRTSRKWTRDEINFVIKFYGQVQDKWLQNQLSGRSIASIKRIAFKYKPKKRRKKFSRNPGWSEAETKILLENYKAMSTDELTDLIPTRSYDAIRAHMYILGIKREKEDLKRAHPSRMWTDEEISILINNAHISIKELKKLLPSRTEFAVRSKRKRYLDDPALFAGVK